MKNGYKIVITVNVLYFLADLFTSSVRYMPFLSSLIGLFTILSLLYAIFIEKSAPKKPPINPYPYRSAEWLKKEDEYRWYKNRNV